ncbi:hypothetical protein CONPUDRAFT_169741 [Coniophora puteana RWD-64-598 SS2]|uniref:DUF6532 domain-containing protein n=1 Tax=Coniophora puteana (strain RWD-64-598) TaxID=741705 RepID=A0A5M3M7E8_CONPW|nr:uncharacterized protein CONPUDRAFT_169741 [Coniophora puteana RWD-64-598 SS2]EIW74784.1 hypothetical protein CONPUDRAFT_169741 [Coniophora puteana RWD-64-598 SS2]
MAGAGTSAQKKKATAKLQPKKIQPTRKSKGDAVAKAALQKRTKAKDKGVASPASLVQGTLPSSSRKRKRPAQADESGGEPEVDCQSNAGGDSGGAMLSRKRARPPRLVIDSDDERHEAGVEENDQEDNSGSDDEGTDEEEVEDTNEVVTSQAIENEKVQLIGRASGSDVEEEGAAVTSKKARLTHRQKKLDDELPEVGHGRSTSKPKLSWAKPSMRKAKLSSQRRQTKSKSQREGREMQSGGSDDSSTDTDSDTTVEYASDGTEWLPQTKLRLCGGKTIGIRAQRSHVQRTLKRGMELMTRYIVLGCDELDWVAQVIEAGFKDEYLESFVSPLAVGGLDPIAFHALADGAEQEGLNKQGDMVQRITTGSYELYVQRCVNYLTNRCGPTRAAIKSAIGTAVVGVFGLDSESRSHDDVIFLWDQSRYIYPKNPKYTGADNNVDESIDRSRPFENLVISKAVKAAFFTVVEVTGAQPADLGLKLSHRLKSSIESLSDEKEITPSMLLMASAAVSAILKDRVNSTSENFTGSWLDSLFKQQLIWLASIRKNFPRRYHELMHGIYKDCTGSSLAAKSMTCDVKRILGEVRWDMMAKQETQETAEPAAPSLASPA